jgi:glycosyltransferase involved in cell wall biosynthesis
MRVIYSVGVRFAGGGIGTTAYHAVRGLHRAGLLQRLLCGSFRPSEIPQERIRAMGWPNRALRKLAVYDPTGWLSYDHDVLYDAWAARRLEPAELFHVWNNFGLRSLVRARKMDLVTVVERASCHPLYQAEVLAEEYRRWGLTWRRPHPALCRALAELERADYVLVPSDFARQTFLERGYPAERLLQVPFGADVERFRPAEERNESPFRVLFVGQISLQKGVLYLLEAWRRLGWRGAELWLVGRLGHEMPPLLARYRNLPGLRWTGYVVNPVSLYQQAHVFCFPSLQEGSALVTYEALACGLPVITTPNAGSVVRHGVEGFLVPMRDVQALQEGLERLRDDAPLRQAMCRAARQRAEAYPWQRYEDDLASALRQAAERGRP